MNKLSDFKNGTKVLWDFKNNQFSEGQVKYVTSGGNVGVQWQDEPEGTVYAYNYTNSHLIINNDLTINENPCISTTQEDYSLISPEDKLKDLIIHLVAVDQTELACCVIEVLKKYKHNLQAQDFIKLNLKGIK